MEPATLNKPLLPEAKQTELSATMHGSPHGSGSGIPGLSRVNFVDWQSGTATGPANLIGIPGAQIRSAIDAAAHNHDSRAAMTEALNRCGAGTMQAVESGQRQAYGANQSFEQMLSDLMHAGERAISSPLQYSKVTHVQAAHMQAHQCTHAHARMRPRIHPM